ncbi:hypothetical protein GJ496_005031 [Pomphorhynchus laevis]|nr:hypothetical protein GJ496_005031 [Pomphorhynchus laevis]
MDNIQRFVETCDSSSVPFDEFQQDKTEPVKQSSLHITNLNANALSADSESKLREVTDYNGSSSLDLFRNASTSSNDYDSRPENDAFDQSGKNKCPHCQRMISVSAWGLTMFHKYEGVMCSGTSRDLSEFHFTYASLLESSQLSLQNGTLADRAVCGQTNPRKRTTSCRRCRLIFHLTGIRINRHQTDLFPLWKCRYCADFSTNYKPSSQHEPTGQSNHPRELQPIWYSNVRTIARLPWKCRREALGKSDHELNISSNSIDSWARLLCLPKLCFSVNHVSAENRCYYHISRIIRVKIKNYQAGPINIVPPNVRKSSGPKSSNVNGNVRAAIMLARKGNYREGMQRLMSTGFVAHGPNSKSKLIALHPNSDSTDLPVSNPLTSAIPFARLYTSLVTAVYIDSHTLSKAVRSFTPGSSATCFEMHPEHLQDCIATYSGGVLLERHVVRTGSLLAALFFTGANLIALPKNDCSIPPIAVGEVFRRLVSKCTCIRVRSVFRDLLSPYQYRVAVEDGVVRIVHQVRSIHKINNMSDSWAWTKIGLSNPFNSVYRSAIFYAVSSRIPEVLPWALFCYGEASYKIVAMHNDQVELPTRLGGLGLRRTTNHSTSAFVASVARVDSVQGLPCSHFPGFDFSFSVLLLTSKIKSIRQSEVFDHLPTARTDMATRNSQRSVTNRFSVTPILRPNPYEVRDSINAQRLQMQPMLPSRRPRWVARSNLPVRRLGGDAREVGNALPPTRLIGETGRYPSLWDLPEAVDFALSNPLQPTFVSMAATIGDLIAHAYAEGVKRRKYKQRLSPPATTSNQQ